LQKMDARHQARNIERKNKAPRMRTRAPEEERIKLGVKNGDDGIAAQKET